MKQYLTRRIFVVFLAWLLLGCEALQAQNAWTVFSTSNSEIGGNTILAVTTDAKNNKWVGTNLGLCRLSGRTWTDYAMFNEKLQNQFVNCLSVDPKGHLWIGTDDYGVIEFDGVHWTEYTKQTREMSMKFIRSITFDRDGVCWIGVTLGGLVRFDGTSWKKYTASDSKLLSDFILCTAVDRNNVKWIGTNDGLCLFDGRTWTAYTTRNSGLPHNIVPAVVLDAEGVAWLGTLGGLCRFDGSQWVVMNTDNSPLPDNQVSALALDGAGMLWIATPKGVVMYDRKGHWHRLSDNSKTSPLNGTQLVAVDAQGNKWFGTAFNGLVRYSAHVVSGRVVDERGHAKEGITIRYGGNQTTTDKDGRYVVEVTNGSSLRLEPHVEGFEVTPSQREWASVTASMLGQDFTVANGMAATGKSNERITVNPFLDQGYITISTESSSAEVEFVDSQGKSIRTIPDYKSGNKINITKMPKGVYTLYIRTNKGEKSLRFSMR